MFALECGAGEPLFPDLTGVGFAEELRDAAKRFNEEIADRMGAHCVRRGAAGAILTFRGNFVRFLDAGHLHSSACTLYLD